MLKLYIVTSVLAIVSLRLSPPEFLQTVWLVFEFAPRWLVFLPLLLIKWWRINLPTFVILLSMSIMNLFLVCGFVINIPPTVNKEDTFSVITFNMGANESQVKEAVLVFLEHNPDIMFLQESERKSLKQALPKDIKFHCNTGLCLLTRHNFEAIDSLSRRETGGWGIFGARYHINLGQCTIDAINVHAHTPRWTLLAMVNVFSEASRARELFLERSLDHIRLKSWLHANPADIVAGDFNTTVNGFMYQRYWTSFKNSFDQAGFGIGNTYKEKGISTRIDHILHTDVFKAHIAEVLEPTGTNHSPLLAQFSLPPDCNSL